MNSQFEGQKIPKPFDSINQPDQAKEVTLNTLLNGMSEIELDFLRKCLVVDGSKRDTVHDLLQHDYFDQRFKIEFERNFAQLLIKDQQHALDLTKNIHLTKDGREELPLSEILTDSDVVEDDEDDDNSSGDDDIHSGLSAGVYQ